MLNWYLSLPLWARIAIPAGIVVLLAILAAAFGTDPVTP